MILVFLQRPSFVKRISWEGGTDSEWLMAYSTNKKILYFPHMLSAISHMLFSSVESRATNLQAGLPCTWTWFWDAVHSHKRKWVLRLVVVQH